MTRPTAHGPRAVLEVGRAVLEVGRAVLEVGRGAVRGPVGLGA